jgi:hypothetical protein
VGSEPRLDCLQAWPEANLASVCCECARGEGVSRGVGVRRLAHRSEPKRPCAVGPGRFIFPPSPWGFIAGRGDWCRAGLLTVDEVKLEYLRTCIKWGAHVNNAKYCLKVRARVWGRERVRVWCC